jgi:enoyl-CoA hydratase
MAYQNILLELKGPLGIVTINRPEVRNALDAQTVSEIRRALEELRQNEGVQVVIFTGAGEKSFAAGADISGLRNKTMLDALLPGMQALYSELEEFEKPTIAAVNGYALGGGCELAMACDIRIASEKAKFGLPELNLGIIPGAGGTQRMARLIGKGKAKELIFTGDIIEAAEAERIGLVNKVVPADQLLSAAEEMAGKMMKKGPLALRLAKMAINAGVETDLKTGLLVEKLAQGILFTTEDKYEGTTAFLEKRPADFKGR